jgi:hypothetical protein
MAIIPFARMLSLILFSQILLGFTLGNAISSRQVSAVPALLAIAPTSSSCAGSPHPQECRTADQAARPICDSFTRYQIDTAGEALALISLMAYESGEFKYQKNYYPGNPGQGTRNMQSIVFNLQYASSFVELQPQIQQIMGTGQTSADLSVVGQNAILALLIGNDDYDFGSAAWFLVTKCSPAIRDGLKAATVTGWEAYLTTCVGTTATPERQAYWDRAKKAFGYTQ